jgi:uridine phosphorylase
VGIIWAAPGAPLAAMVMEDLVACDAKLFIGVGLLAATQPKIDVGDHVIPSLAVRDEGTSYHHLPEDVMALPSNEVIRSLQYSCEEFKVKYYVGPIRTTDAPYRVTRSKIDYLRGRGILGINMESSIIFALRIYRKVKVGCILMASSNLTQPKPTMGFYIEDLRNAMVKAVKISIEAAARHK